MQPICLEPERDKTVHGSLYFCVGQFDRLTKLQCDWYNGLALSMNSHGDSCAEKKAAGDRQPNV